MSRASSPFNPATMALVLLVGAGAFLLLLYALGQGWDGGKDRNGGEHAASNSLTGFAGLVSLLEAGGQEIKLSRSPASFEDYALVVLTPPLTASAEEVEAALESRKYLGPTLLVLPKWRGLPVPSDVSERVGAKPGWVILADAAIPPWFAELSIAKDTELAIGGTASWDDFGNVGPLADTARVMALVKQKDGAFEPLVVDAEGDILAGQYWDYSDDDAWPVLVVFEPDLLNNYGMADQKRAALALGLVDAAMNGEDAIPVVFDLTFAGLGRSENLLTLAFTPPFLAATLCLLLAALVIAWRAFRRFGPPIAELPALAQGKTQLARNGAGVLGRARRWHLLAEPYAALVSARIAGRLAIRANTDAERDAAIERALVRRGHKDTAFPRLAHAMRSARKPSEILRAARALKSIERTLKR